MKTTNWIILRSKDRGTDYGVGTFIKQLSDGLSQQMGIEVFVIEIGTDSLSEFTIEKKSGVTYFKFPQTNHLKNPNTKTNLSRFAKSIVRVVVPFLPKEQKTVVHLNFVYQCFIGEEFKKTMDCYLIFTQHLFIQQSSGVQSLLDTESLTYALVDRIITVTKHGKEHLINKLVDERKIIPIYNGIDPHLFGKKDCEINIRRKYGIGLDKKIVLYSGRIDHIKGLKYLSLAFSILLKKLPDCRLIIAGNGDYEELIQNSKTFSSNINYLGFIPFEDLVALYQEASIGVIPSLEEHCSYVALEMLFSGLPVVATCLGGLKEIFIHNENAFLVDTIPDQTNAFGIAPDIDQLADYMYNLLTNDQLRKKFSQNTIIRANEEFTMNTMADKYVATLRNLQ